MDFAPNSREEWRLSLFNQFCENKLENCRKFWNLWKLFNIIQSQSSFQIDPNSILFNRVLRPWPARRPRSPPRRPDAARAGPGDAAGCAWARRAQLDAARSAAQTSESVGDVRERRLAKFRQNVARFRLYRLRFLQENMRFAAFFKIYQILKLKFLKFDKILQILRHLQFFCWNFTKIAVFSNRFFAKILRLQRCKRMQIL